MSTQHKVLNLKDGVKVTLSFNMYFINRFCQLTNLPLSKITNVLLGKIDAETQTMSGGLMDDLTVRAQAVAAGIDAFNFEKGDPSETNTIEGFRVMEQVVNSLTNPVWAEMYVMILKIIVPDNLPKEESKKVAKKKGEKTAKKKP